MTEVVNGYHGGFKSDVNENQLQKCSENEIKENFFLNQKASIKSDSATINYEERQSNGPGVYSIDNMYGCECGCRYECDVGLRSSPPLTPIHYTTSLPQLCATADDSETLSPSTHHR